MISGEDAISSKTSRCVDINVVLGSDSRESRGGDGNSKQGGLIVEIGDCLQLFVVVEIVVARPSPDFYQVCYPQCAL